MSGSLILFITYAEFAVAGYNYLSGLTIAVFIIIVLFFSSVKHFGFIDQQTK